MPALIPRELFAKPCALGVAVRDFFGNDGLEHEIAEPFRMVEQVVEPLVLCAEVVQRRTAFWSREVTIKH